MSIRNRLSAVGAGLVMALTASTCVGYIHFPPATMQRMCQQATKIRVLTVKKHDKEKGVIVYELTDTLKGMNPKGMSFRHSIGKETEGTKPIFDWVANGKKAVMLTIEGNN